MKEIERPISNMLIDIYEQEESYLLNKEPDISYISLRVRLKLHTRARNTPSWGGKRKMPEPDNMPSTVIINSRKQKFSTTIE